MAMMMMMMMMIAIPQTPTRARSRARACVRARGPAPPTQPAPSPVQPASASGGEPLQYEHHNGRPDDDDVEDDDDDDDDEEEGNESDEDGAKDRMENLGFAANQRSHAWSREEKAFRTHVVRRRQLSAVGKNEVAGNDGESSSFGYRRASTASRTTAESPCYPEADDEDDLTRTSESWDDAASREEDTRFREALFKPVLPDDAESLHSGNVKTSVSGSTSLSSQSTWRAYASGGADPAFTAALQRWRLHKQCSKESQPYFPPTGRGQQQQQVFGDDSAGTDWETKELERIAAQQHRVLARCFRKLAVNSEGRRRTRASAQILVAKRQQTSFLAWHRAYRAVRFDRLNALSRAFRGWQSLVDEEHKYSQLCVIGESYYELSSKRRALTRLLANQQSCRRIDILESRVRTSVRKHKLRRALRTWHTRAACSHNERNAQSVAHAYRRMLGLFTGVQVLRRNAALAVRARRVHGVAQRRSAAEALQRWRLVLEGRIRNQMQLEGAQLVHEFRLSKRVFLSWAEHCEDERMARRAARRVNRTLARQALTSLGRGAAARLVLRERERVAYRHWATRSATRGLRALVEHAVENSQTSDAAALRDVQHMRRAFGGWLATVWLAKCDRVANRHWRRRQARQGLAALRVHWVEATASDAHMTLATMSDQRRVLSSCMRAWQMYALDALEARIEHRAADQFRRLHLASKVLHAWRDHVLEFNDLARAYEHVRIAKVAKECLRRWHGLATQWIACRNAIQRRQAQRALLAWQNLASEASRDRHGLRLAAMFHRKSLLSRAFGTWVDAWCVQRSEGYVMGMAARHADLRRLSKVFGAWAFWAADQRPCAPLTAHDAQALYEARLLRRCFRLWAREVVLLVRLSSHCLRKLGATLAQRQSRAIRYSSHAGRVGLFVRLLHNHGARRRFFARWKMQADSGHRQARVPAPRTEMRGGPGAARKLTVPRGAWSGTAYLSALSHTEAP